MNTSFVAFLNKRGIACASDTDMTLYALSRQEPVALAVNSYSPIPWDTVINTYLRQGEITKHEVFGDYARDFANYLSTVPTKPLWQNLSEDDGNIIFLGFGTDDVFPSAVDIQIHLDEEGNKLVCDFNIERSVDHNHDTDFFMLSHFENTQPLINGISEVTRKKIIDKHNALFQIFEKRIMDAVKGTEFEEAIKQNMDEFNDTCDFPGVTYNMTGRHLQSVSTALDSFNIEDLVKVAEDFVDAKIQIDHLKQGGIGECPHTKELAVITRTEGVVWIKHCLYGN